MEGFHDPNVRSLMTRTDQHEENNRVKDNGYCFNEVSIYINVGYKIMTKSYTVIDIRKFFIVFTNSTSNLHLTTKSVNTYMKTKK